MKAPHLKSDGRMEEQSVILHITVCFQWAIKFITHWQDMLWISLHHSFSSTPLKLKPKHWKLANFSAANPNNPCCSCALAHQGCFSIFAESFHGKWAHLNHASLYLSRENDSRCTSPHSSQNLFFSWCVLFCQLQKATGETSVLHGALRFCVKPDCEEFPFVQTNDKM